MLNVLKICRKELLCIFVSPIAYCVLTSFSLLASFFFFTYLSEFNRTLINYSSQPFAPANSTNMSLNPWVVELYYHTLVLVFVFVLPLLSMRSIAEERREGTHELLLTAPISALNVILGKFFALGVVVCLLVGIALFFPLVLFFFATPELAPILSGSIGLLLAGLSFISVGLAASAFTENQIIAGLGSFVLLLLLYTGMVLGQSLGNTLVLSYLSPAWQVKDLIEGVVSVRSGIYFLSVIVFSLLMALRGFEHERW